MGSKLRVSTALLSLSLLAWSALCVSASAQAVNVSIQGRIYDTTAAVTAPLKKKQPPDYLASAD